ncbi:MAG: acyl-CoA thioesterase II [Microthrixaceae bacterium]|nr:acyl-CoA thioesterase II [Microthrixaceae bacterium]MCB9387279.1 acyl-CoA thioesterase II [Microthrixaceae bacterium]
MIEHEGTEELDQNLAQGNEHQRHAGVAELFATLFRARVVPHRGGIHLHCREATGVAPVDPARRTGSVARGHNVGVDQAAVDSLIALLDLERIEVNIFRGNSPDEDRQRVYGGQVAGQALVAAARTVDCEKDDEGQFHVHSLHAYFLRGGDPTVPIVYEVDRIRDGRSYATRRVQAIQHGRPIFHLSASFGLYEEGFDHQFPMPEGLPEPESLPGFKERMEPYRDLVGDWFDRPLPLDTRYCGPSPWERKAHLPPYQNIWLRANGKLPDDPVLHICILTYASDMSLLDTTLQPHGESFAMGDVFMASLDHAMWFHRRFRSDEWLLYAQDTPSASHGRGLGRGLVYGRDGTLVASVMQEGVIRKMRPGGGS